MSPCVIFLDKMSPRILQTINDDNDMKKLSPPFIYTIGVGG